MFFSCEYGVRSSPGGPVEPKFFNADCPTGFLLRYIRDSAVNDVNIETSERKKIEQNRLKELEDKISTTNDAKTKGLLETEKKSRIAVIESLDDIVAKIRSIQQVDLCYSEKPNERMHLESLPPDQSAISVLVPRSRTFLVGIEPQEVLLSFELNQIKK